MDEKPMKQANSPAKADLILTSGKIWTVDCDNPRAEAVAVWNDTILAVGSARDIAPLAGTGTEVIDLGGR